MSDKENTVKSEDIILWERVISDVTPLNLLSREKKSQGPDAESLTTTLATKTTQNVFQRKNIKSRKKELISVQRLKTRQHALVDIRKGQRAGMDRNTHKKFSRGKLPIDRRLDLHGFTAFRAENRLVDFIKTAAFDGCRCVLIVTGKGTGILKANVPEWLSKEPLVSLVLAIAPAQPTHGGAGALYVLLRRNRARVE